ncbi:glycosyltransferase [Streptomyces clavifer]|uniref:glycosyltransferase n=1 Tax=Streptomyces clavifer TaxID=68188 RepID=UPI0036BD8104
MTSRWTETVDDEVAVSFVIPMYNEAEIAREAVERVLKVGAEWGRTFEVLAVDDGSSDGTPEVLKQLKSTEKNFRWIQLRPNCGQPASSKAGMLSARGRMVVVLDADLQTPPEFVPELVDALDRAGPEVVAVFGVTSTTKRDDPLRLLIGQAVFYFLETRLGRVSISHGASSFFVMRRSTARQIGRLAFTKGNVGAIMAALGMGMETVSYVKPKSYRDESRLGLKGHVEEALGSLALTGVLSRFGWTAAGFSAYKAARGIRRSRRLALLSLGVAGISVVGVAAVESFNRRSLRISSNELPIFEGETAEA